MFAPLLFCGNESRPQLFPVCSCAYAVSRTGNMQYIQRLLVPGILNDQKRRLGNAGEKKLFIDNNNSQESSKNN